MKKTEENGFAHLQLIVGLVAIVGLVSFAAFRVGQSQSNNRESSDTNGPETVQEIKVVEPEEEQKEVVIPEEVKEVAAAPVEKSVSKTETTTEQKKSDKTWIKMTKVSISQSGGTITLVSKLETPQTGTCNFKIRQEGYDKVYTSAAVQNSTDCTAQLDVSNLPIYTGWSLYGWFDSSDGKVSASQAEEAITIQVP